MENISEHQNSNEQYPQEQVNLLLQRQINLLSEELYAQRIMLEDALAYASHLEGKVKSLATLSDILQHQLRELKNTTDEMNRHVSILN
jgi:hypothetical protein